MSFSRGKCGAMRTMTLTLTGLAWGGMVVLGFGMLSRYETTPGLAGKPSSHWPMDTTLRPDRGRPNVVFAVHPRCPCTRASMEGLAAIVAEFPDAPSVRMLVYRPTNAPANWGEAMPPVAGPTWVDDPDGREAAKFGLRTSGAIAAYDASGQLQFHGGITRVRGRKVFSEGYASVCAILRGELPPVDFCLAYGCNLDAFADGVPAREAVP